MAALDKVGSLSLRTEFRRDARRFLEEIVNCLLSTVTSRSVIVQGMRCFFPAIVVNGDDVAPFQLFKKLLNRLFQKSWTRGSEVEACIFQVFQLTALVIRVLATHGFNRVAIKEDKLRAVLLRVQDFVLSQHFTQRSLLTLLSECVAIADSITSNPVYAP